MKFIYFISVIYCLFVLFYPIEGLPVNGEESVNGALKAPDFTQSNANIEFQVIKVPQICPKGQRLDPSGVCQIVFTVAEQLKYLRRLYPMIIPRMASPTKAPISSQIITVPMRCPDGQRKDSTGMCHPVF